MNSLMLFFLYPSSSLSFFTSLFSFFVTYLNAFMSRSKNHLSTDALLLYDLFSSHLVLMSFHIMLFHPISSHFISFYHKQHHLIPYHLISYHFIIHNITSSLITSFHQSGGLIACHVAKTEGADLLVCDRTFASLDAVAARLLGQVRSDFLSFFLFSYFLCFFLPFFLFPFLLFFCSVTTT